MLYRSAARIPHSNVRKQIMKEDFLSNDVIYFTIYFGSIIVSLFSLLISQRPPRLIPAFLTIIVIQLISFFPFVLGYYFYDGYDGPWMALIFPTLIGIVTFLVSIFLLILRFITIIYREVKSLRKIEIIKD